MSTPGNLTESVRVRLDASTKLELERRAGELDRKPGALARQFIRDGLAKPTRRGRGRV